MCVRVCVRACVCVYVCVCVRACVCLWRRPEPWRAVEGSSLYPAYCGDALLGLAAAGGAALCALFLVFAAASAAADALVRVVVLEFVADLQVDRPGRSRCKLVKSESVVEPETNQR